MGYASSLYLTGAELGLSLVGLALLLVVAWTSHASARLVTILAVAALFGAAIFTGGALFDTSPAGDAFGGLYRVDAFGSFAKVLIYLATIACLIVSPKYFAERGAYRGEYPVPDAVQRGGHGHDGLGHQPHDAVHRARAIEPVELHLRQLPQERLALERGGAQVFHSRRASPRASSSTA